MENISPARRESIRNPVVNNGVLGMLVFLATEAMFFGGLISAFIVNRSENLGAWPPPWQPRLPVEITAVNTVILLLSGVAMFFVHREMKKKQDANVKKANNLFLVTMALGATFLIIQGSEWVKLVHEGLTTSTSLFSSFFYTIVGTHGLHALVGLLYLVYIGLRVIKTDDALLRYRYISTTSVYWYFVVGLWPILYVLVYLL